jgi:hypothetical protein
VYVGEVTNDGPPLSVPVVEGTFYDAAGNVIATESGRACRVMPSKGISAFKVVLPPGTPDPARAEWKLAGETTDDAGLATGLTAELFGTGPAFAGATKGQVFGEIRNNSTNVYQFGFVCVAWVNAKGEVIRVAEGTAAGMKFAPGDVLPFSVFEDIPPEAVDAVFFLDAGVTLPPRPAPVFVPLAGSAFQNKSEVVFPGPNGGTVMLGTGEIRNTSSSTIAAVVSASTRGADGHPNGASVGGGECRVPAEPGGITYGSYILVSAASGAPPLDVKLDAIAAPESGAPEILSVSGVTRSNASGGLQRVRGTIRNDSGARLSTIFFCAAVYDANGDVIGMAPGFAEVPMDGLAPNETITVQADVPAFGTGTSAKMIAAGFE